MQGKASLRILESYPDGESWVMRVVNRQKPDNVQSLQVRGFALCLLPAARKASMLLSQQTKLLHVSSRFGLPSGFVSTTGRQACPQGALVVSGGFGLDPEYRGPAAPRLELNYPDPNGWNVRAVNGAPGSGPAADARTYAVCLGTKEGVDIRDFQNVYFVDKDVTVKADNGTAGSGRLRRRRRLCARRRRAHGEGTQRQCRDAGKLPRLAGKLDVARDQPRRQEGRRRDGEALRGVHQEVGRRVSGARRASLYDRGNERSFFRRIVALARPGRASPAQPKPTS